MPWVIGGSLLVSAYGAREAGKQAEAGIEAGLALDMEALEFDKEQYADWQRIFGPVQDNLRDYYLGLTPETVEAQGLEEVQQVFGQLREQLPTALSQRGIDPDDGLGVTLEQRLDIKQAEAEAGVRIGSEAVVAEQRQGFLSRGVINPNAPNITAGLRRAGTRQFGFAEQAQQSQSAFIEDFAGTLGTVARNRNPSGVEETASTPTTRLT